MGNCTFKILRVTKKDFISEKSLYAVRNVIEYLKEDVIQRDIFRGTGHDAISQQIARELHRGGPNLYQLLEESSIRDIASGLMFYLIYLRKPLIPPNIQAIVLDPDNTTIEPEVVARDVLGMLEEQIHGRQFRLLQYILDFLNHILKYTPTDELTGTTVPIYMMPVFFNLQAEHMTNWRRVAIIFLEMIRLAPQALNISSSNNELALNNLIAHNLIPSGMRTFTRCTRNHMDAINSVMRRYHETNGNRGDGSFMESYRRRQQMLQDEIPSI